jgi:hypothetical protein
MEQKLLQRGNVFVWAFMLVVICAVCVVIFYLRRRQLQKKGRVVDNREWKNETVPQVTTANAAEYLRETMPHSKIVEQQSQSTEDVPFLFYVDPPLEPLEDGLHTSRGSRFSFNSSDDDPDELAPTPLVSAEPPLLSVVTKLAPLEPEESSSSSEEVLPPASVISLVRVPVPRLPLPELPVRPAKRLPPISRYLPGLRAAKLSVMANSAVPASAQPRERFDGFEHFSSTGLPGSLVESEKPVPTTHTNNYDKPAPAIQVEQVCHISLRLLEFMLQ